MEPGTPGNDLITCNLPGGERLVVSRYGGQVLSWCDARGRELLYLSPTSTGKNATPIRGGIPVCFPQFGSRGTLPKHGFARTMVWTEIDDVSGPGTGVHLQLREQPQTLAVWPHRFLLDLWAMIDKETLRVSIRVQNTGTQAWKFTTALHTYLRVSAIADTMLYGLQGTPYEDALNAGGRVVAAEESPDFSCAIDRIYCDVPRRLTLRDSAKRLEISQQGFTDTVVWNPGQDGNALLGDMPVGDENHMLCIEAAQVTKSIEVMPGQAWAGSQQVRFG